MPALSGQLKAIQTQFGKKALQKMTPKENLANVRAMMTQYGSQALDEFNKPKTTTEAGPANSSGQTPNGTTAQKPDTGGVVNNMSAGSLGTSSSTIQNSKTLQALEEARTNPSGANSTNSEPAQTTTTKDGEGPGHWEEQTLPDPPAGIIPGTPAYDAWKKDWEAKNPRKWISEAPAPGSGPTTDETPGAKGITFTSPTRGGRRIFGDNGFTITAEQLAGMPPEAQQELRDLAAKGATSQQLSQFRMKYWGEPWAEGLMKSALQNANPGALAKGALRNARGGGWGGAGNTGIKWMDNKYWNNIDAAAAEEEAPPPPASGGGIWEQGPEGPIWNPNPQQPPQGGQPPQWPPQNIPYDAPWPQWPPQQPPQGGQPPQYIPPGWYGPDSGFPGSGPIPPPPVNPYQDQNPYTLWMQRQFQQQYDPYFQMTNQQGGQ